MEMTIQELIDKLVAAKAEHGNLPCVYEGGAELSPVVCTGKYGSVKGIKVMDLVG